MLSTNKNTAQNTTLFNKNISSLELAILQEIESCIPKKVPLSEKKEFLKKCKNALLQNKTLIKKMTEDDSFRTHFLEDPDFRHQTLKDLAPQNYKIKIPTPSWSNVITTVIIGGLMFASGVAAQSPYIVHDNSIPMNGTDLCQYNSYDSNVISCTQGFITNGTMPWEPSMPQYQVSIFRFNKNADSNTGDGLKKQMAGSKVGTLVAEAYTNGTSPKLVDCLLSSSSVDSYEVRGKATKIQEDACEKAQDRFSFEVEVFKSLQKRNQNILIGALCGGIGGIIAIAFCAAASHIREHRAARNNIPGG